ncbi:hypothetical protein BMIN_1633 [Bifidobacterium minimum]|uniref:Uncharacterized protein n=1 Tax=Bifidobacterium minimum TaxID=1693 RepID=A0A087BIV8_9BIFI|nr:hypothetical protein BMIN_1633 [Bifidobacterium minimum]
MELRFSRLHFARKASRTMAKIVVMVSASKGVPTHAIARPTGVPVMPRTSTMLAASIRTTGRRMTLIASKNVGRCSDGSRVSPASTSEAIIGTSFTIQRAISGPETTTTGIATSNPSPRVRPRLAFSASMATKGPGCGGMNACNADRPARAGMPRATTGIFARRAARRIIVMSITTPTSKNSGMPTMNALNAIAQLSLFRGAFARMVSTMTSAPPERVSRIPMIPPSATSNPTQDTVLPTPSVKLSRLL